MDELLATAAVLTAVIVVLCALMLFVRGLRLPPTYHEREKLRGEMRRRIAEKEMEQRARELNSSGDDEKTD